MVPVTCTQTPFEPAGGPVYVPEPGAVSVLIADTAGVGHTVGAAAVATVTARDDEAPGTVSPAAGWGSSGVSASPARITHPRPLIMRAPTLGALSDLVVTVRPGV